MNNILKTLLFFFISSLSISCNFNQVADKQEALFNMPIVYNSGYKFHFELSNDTTEYISEVFPRVIGKYKFTDSIDISVQNNDTTFLNDYFFENFSKYEIIDSLDVNGLELITDYKTTVRLQDRYTDDSLFYEYYPTYLVNSTKTEKFFLAKDSYAFGIQEAKFIKDRRSYNHWYAIEGIGWDGCGNGSWGVIVRPQEFMLILMRKYKGDYLTQIRIRLRNGETTYVSKGFQGLINESQFTIQNKSFIERMTSKENSYAADGIFLGSHPKWNR